MMIMIFTQDILLVTVKKHNSITEEDKNELKVKQSNDLFIYHNTKYKEECNNRTSTCYYGQLGVYSELCEEMCPKDLFI